MEPRVEIRVRGITVRDAAGRERPDECEREIACKESGHDRSATPEPYRAEHDHQKRDHTDRLLSFPRQVHGEEGSEHANRLPDVLLRDRDDEAQPFAAYRVVEPRTVRPVLTARQEVFSTIFPLYSIGICMRKAMTPGTKTPAKFYSLIVFVLSKTTMYIKKIIIVFLYQ